LSFILCAGEIAYRAYLGTSGQAAC